MGLHELTARALPLACDYRYAHNGAPVDAWCAAHCADHQPGNQNDPEDPIPRHVYNRCVEARCLHSADHGWRQRERENVGFECAHCGVPNNLSDSAFDGQFWWCITHRDFQHVYPLMEGEERVPMEDHLQW